MVVNGWVWPEAVTAVMGIKPYGDVAQRLAIICSGLNAAVAQWRPDLTVPAVDTTDPDYATNTPDWDARIHLGLVALASKWFSQLGTQDTPDYDGMVGPPPLISREIELLLEVGRAGRPVAI